VFRSIVAALKDDAAADERARAAGPPQYDPDTYYSSDDEEGYALASALSNHQALARVLQEMASWAALPVAPAPGARLPAVTNIARQIVMLPVVKRCCNE
jgi:hypothetical protein